MDTLADLGFTVFEALSPVVLAVVSWIGLKFAQIIKAKTDNQLLENGLLRINQAVHTAVLEVEQTLVSEIKNGRKAKSPGGKRLTKDERQKVLDAAVSKAKSYMGMRGLKELTKITGSSANELTSLLQGKIERTVKELKSKHKLYDLDW